MYKFVAQSFVLKTFVFVFALLCNEYFCSCCIHLNYFHQSCLTEWALCTWNSFILFVYFFLCCATYNRALTEAHFKLLLFTTWCVISSQRQVLIPGVPFSPSLFKNNKRRKRWKKGIKFNRGRLNFRQVWRSALFSFMWNFLLAYSFT